MVTKYDAQPKTVAKVHDLIRALSRKPRTIQREHFVPKRHNYVLITPTNANTTQLIAMNFSPSGQNLADSVGNLRGLWLLVEGIHAEIWVVSDLRSHAEIQGNFKMGVERRGKGHQKRKKGNEEKKESKKALG